MRTSQLAAVVGIILLPSLGWSAPREASPTFQLCRNQRGGIVAKSKCTKKETRLTFDALRGEQGEQGEPGGTGLNVYDADGVKIGPLVALGQTITEIDGKKYSLRFGPDGLIGNTTTILYSQSGCTGTAYARHVDELDAFSQLSSAFVARPGRTLYLIIPGVIEDIAHASAHTTSSMSGNCREGTVSEEERGYEVIVKGAADQLFPGPFDVRE